MNDKPCSFTAAQVARACRGRLACGNPAARALGVSVDTRTLQPGQAFFALAGKNHDGHDYLPQAAAAGATVFVVHRLPGGWRAPDHTAVVLVEETSAALLDLGARHRRALKAKVAAVTGSYGKSTVKAMLAAALSRAGRCTAAKASFNNRIGVALTLLSAATGDDFVVLEMGTNHAGEIDELARAARPDLGVVTGIGEAHLEGLGSLEGVREAKGELIPHLNPLGTLVLNADDPLCASLAGRFGGQVRTFGFGRAADVRVRRLRRTSQGWRFEALGCAFRLKSGARHDVLNAAAALCAASALGVPPAEAAAALAGFEHPPLRYERLELSGVTFIRDCYNSNPSALRAALGSFLLEKNPGRKVVVCGDMLELGERAHQLHRQAGAGIAGAAVDLLVGVGRMAPDLVEGWLACALPGRFALCFTTADEAWEPLWKELRPGDAVLLKGSRALRLETVTDRIAAYLEEHRKEAAA